MECHLLQTRQGESDLVLVNGEFYLLAAYTSQRCSRCGHTERANRPTQAHFYCVSCGHTTSADTNAAINISRAAVIPPIVSETALPSRQGQAA
jgi:transposase